MLVYIKTTIIAIVAIFTVTLLFGFISSDSTTLKNATVEYYFNDDPTPDAWMEEGNWIPDPQSSKECIGTVEPCRITLEDNQDLQTFLDSFEDKEALLDDHQVEAKD